MSSTLLLFLLSTRFLFFSRHSKIVCMNTFNSFSLRIVSLSIHALVCKDGWKCFYLIVMFCTVGLNVSEYLRQHGHSVPEYSLEKPQTSEKDLPETLRSSATSTQGSSSSTHSEVESSSEMNSGFVLCIFVYPFFFPLSEIYHLPLLRNGLPVKNFLLRCMLGQSFDGLVIQYLRSFLHLSLISFLFFLLSFFFPSLEVYCSPALILARSFT